MNLTIKNVPSALHDLLKRSAERHRRSLNSEIIVRLEESTGLRAVDVAKHLQQTRAVRERLAGVYLTDDELARYKEEGRP